MTRFYPDHLPAIPDEPCWEDFCVLDVDGKRGQGVLVLRDFPEGSVLFRMNGTLTRKMTLHSLQMEPGLHLDDPYFAGKVLHSCEPNSWLDPTTRLFHATRNITSGELLTMDYDETEDLLFRSFDCCCGSAQCRGTIGGRLYEGNRKRRRLRKVAGVAVAPTLDPLAERYRAVVEERRAFGTADLAPTTAV